MTQIFAPHSNNGRQPQAAASASSPTCRVCEGPIDTARATAKGLDPDVCSLACQVQHEMED